VAERLTNFDGMWNAYPFPKGSADDVKRTIGGAVDVDWITNTCVVRVSRAFNLAGHPVPRNAQDEILTVSGRDGMQYALRVREFRKYLTRRYGQPSLSHRYDPPTGGIAPASFAGRRGVICFEVTGWSDATGHFDLWDGDDTRHASYFNKASEVLLWEVGADPPPQALTGSVGEGGVNRQADVERVQRLLVKNGYEPGAIDGDPGARTIAAIRSFQSRFLSVPDGRVDVNGRTWRELLGH
jgi:Type VI secretion system (T6SS), amidase effector protein 4/Putative peptidoglycan binding domain